MVHTFRLETPRRNIAGNQLVEPLRYFHNFQGLSHKLFNMLFFIGNKTNIEYTKCLIMNALYAIFSFLWFFGYFLIYVIGMFSNTSIQWVLAERLHMISSYLWTLAKSKYKNHPLIRVHWPLTEWLYSLNISSNIAYHGSERLWHKDMI